MAKRDWEPAQFRSLDALHAELDALEAAHDAGTLRTTGRWSAGQIFDHCARMVRFSFDGFEGIRAPWALRAAAAAVFKPRLAKTQMRPGVRLPAKAAGLLPPDSVPFAEGLAALRTQLARIDAGERMTQDSPVLGRMTHEQWVQMHLNHCRMHFGFLRR